MKNKLLFNAVTRSERDWNRRINMFLNKIENKMFKRKSLYVYVKKRVCIYIGGAHNSQFVHIFKIKYIS